MKYLQGRGFVKLGSLLVGFRGSHSCVLEDSNGRCSNIGNIFDGDNFKLEFPW
jgi:hypothetical protein